MTNEEALEQLKKNYLICPQLYPEEYYLQVEGRLKRGIPYKPIKIKIDNKIKYTCRMCDYILPNEIVEFLVKRDGHDLIFCPHCSQAIDFAK